MVILLSLPTICLARQVEDVASFIHSPEELSEWLPQNVQYELEMPDYWQSAEETLKRHKGDCDDFAILSSAILSELKIPNQVLIIKFRGISLSHAVCAFKSGEFCAFVSNGQIISTKAYLIRGAVEEAYPDWETIVFTNANKDRLKVVSRNKVDRAVEVGLETALRSR
ncbi:MAG: hypothetical protein MUC39_00505 [Candidatus Omnitrophica bacterium]|nr:hypothetical protein [Candidatus Omnitrophota bacterium]